MKWTPRGRSADIEDRRGAPSGFGGGGFRMGRLPMGGGGASMGLGGLAVLVVLALVFGRDFLSMSADPNANAVPYETSGPVASTPEEEKLVEVVSFVLDDSQNMWTSLMPGYQRAKLVLFRDATPSACGLGQSATGPFYCPADQKVYIDLAFYEELRRRFGAPGDFAQAYVLAHEIGHHVQNLQGVERQVRQLQQSRPGAANDLSVRMELQADCYAGVWGYSASQRNHLEPGDVEEGLAAAAAIGDDRIQRMSGGRVAPERWTHGSSEQRVQWFRRGMQSGRPQDCDTFATR